MILKIGSKGENVKKVQSKLGITADGIFGPKTENELINWKIKNGLGSTGIVDQMAWDLMFPVNIVGGINLQLLEGIIPNKVLIELPSVMDKFKINNNLRISHFLSQCEHESGGFSLVVENLNYSAEQLAKTWPKRYSLSSKPPHIPNALAKKIERNPQMIGNATYSNRMGNGGPETNEGFMYRGRGYIQLTGKNNYISFSKFVEDDVVKIPDLVAKKYPLSSAGWFFHTNNLNLVCDRGSDIKTITSVTRIINGGTTHLEDRISRFYKFWNLLK
jgi:putative chitinase